MKALPPSVFKDLFLNRTHLIDVRAPVEFGVGTIPGAVNLPLLTDSERQAVGTTYKNEGQEAAIRLGHQLVSGAVKESRIDSWTQEIARHPDAVVFCLRGGLRSQIVQSWIAERNIERPIIEGGYKALRRFLMESLASLSQSLKFEVVSGPTGSGKTTYLQKSGRLYLDLEALAAHRGSAFGAMPEPQPGQIDFENRVAVDLIRLSKELETMGGTLLVEDESRMIGSRIVPEVLFNRMMESPRIVLDVPLEERVQNILRDYVLESSLGIRGDLRRFDDFRGAIQAISKKLGGLRTDEILRDLQVAQAEFEGGRGFEANREWIRKILIWYYDPLYERWGKKNQPAR